MTLTELEAKAKAGIERGGGSLDEAGEFLDCADTVQALIRDHLRAREWIESVSQRWGDLKLGVEARAVLDAMEMKP